MISIFKGLRGRGGNLRYLFHVPTLSFLFFITLIPFLYVINLSFRSYSFSIPGMTGQFIGLENFRRLLNEDPMFWHSISLTLVFTFLSVSIELGLGMGIANLLNQDIRGRRIFTTLFMIPMMISPIVVGLLWKFMLNPELGILMFFLKKFGFTLKEGLLSSGKTAFLTILFVDVWGWTPFVTLIILAGLQSMPKDPFEAARIAGANSLQIFFYIALPLIKPLIIIVVLLRSIDAFRVFDTIYILTGGGPGSATELGSIYGFRINFKFWDMGYGASYVLFLFLIVLIVTDLLFFFTQRKTYMSR